MIFIVPTHDALHCTLKH